MPPITETERSKDALARQWLAATLAGDRVSADYAFALLRRLERLHPTR